MTLFGSFETTLDAERAAAALLDRGAKDGDLSVIAHSGSREGAVAIGEEASHADHVAKHGVTAATGSDAAYGAAKGLSFGAGLGVLGAIAALAIPGVGLVVGAGALATAIAGTAAAGAAAGGLVGYLKDQGMGEEIAATYESRIAAGGAVLAVSIPSGDLDETVAESLLVKYGAVGVFTAYPGASAQPSHTTPHVVPSEPLEAGNLTAPLNSVSNEVPVSAVTPTRSDPVTGLAIEGYVDDPVTGVRRPVRFENGRAYYVA